jgi:arylsulfatase
MTFQQFPPRQRPASFTIDQITEKLMNFKGK